ncbi:DEAD-box ATP-dependent RNA helicase 41-like [Corylus avellana]|uniref:DEAD-box ATP-dependent RNA helicase 41-like n=1 Tax=Corylus avellana TaxID=13451 RepID=UPI001E23E5B7|nr:DEAD-box ATP-dependent RNA helicase 41-like [Corylus avellana]XP_059429644.1 DEAD-box ATP-dependent RNA helicase 41-like [Corylus avellana]XP_059429645.1 DEAD-box ATP-dependent RNA helicase 41-like [Corylus avellana]XP_059429646.1 DEAD-box ATP-dependent RNA helicase 41-like [Corylus avellana]XP_059429647.1 DEAD-box ATP-dependent RNA helicase 41-like [Corylus avellana]XP_059429648.1 DEAD-box ATP-dependent RNA helicase 41-like [Corylus avellana]XP_059429649.1 DEAD-box ATP-dependent RNA helic
MEDGNKVNQCKSEMLSTDGDVSTVLDEADKIKERCREQREALPGEPKCIICHRYGEYICDETDDDVCSLECKQALLCRVANSQLPVGLPPPKKLPATDECFYVRDSDDKSGSLSLTMDQTESLRRKLEIHVKGELAVAPMLSFSSCNLPQKLLQNIEVAGYDVPTPVQMQAIPAALMGKSLLVSADTGSGKTASFLVPVVSRCANIRIESSSSQRKPLAIVLTPTRELCIQVEEHAKLLAKSLPFRTALVVGGDAMAGQRHRIEGGVELVIGTPGRLIDLLTKHDIELDDVMIFVLDEVDSMLQRGFRDQVMQIFRALSQPQVLMYSATISQEVEKITSCMAKDIIVISVGKPNRPSKAVKQLAIWVESKHKKQKLFDILMSKHHFMPPVVVYVGSRLGADLLSNAITVTTGMKALSMHGEKSMKERREIMRTFLVGEVPVIVATGVLGRGLDLLGVKQVIVFDMPNSIKEYIHQIGRASRLGEEGTAIVFVNEENKNMFPELIKILKTAGAAVPRELVNSRFAVGFLSGGEGQKRRKRGC